MGLKKLFYGIFDAPTWQDFKRAVIGIAETDDSVKKDVATVETKADEIKVDIGVVDGKIQGIIDNPPQVTVDLSPVLAKMGIMSLMLTSVLQLQPMAIWLGVPSAIQNEVISIPVMVHQDLVKTLEAFGLDVHFDPTYFALDGFEKGSLTQNWANVDGNEVTDGVLRLGGFVGDPANLSEVDIGSLIIIKLTVLSDGVSPTSDILIDSYVDDIKDFKPNPYVMAFEYGQ